MNPRNIAMLVAALGVAGVTAYGVQGYLAQPAPAPVPADVAAPAAQKIPTVSVLIAAEEIPTGTFVRPELLAWQDWPEANVRDDYLVEGETTIEEMVGGVIRARMFPGQPVTKARLVNPGDRGFLAAVLDPGKRAVSVPINATSGVGGFVFPGDSVDVILSFTVNVSDEESGTSQSRYFGQTVLSDVRVLAIDQTVDNEEGAARVAKTATLEVTPKEAEKISVALEIGDLALSLNSLARVDASEPDGTQKADPTGYTSDVDVLGMYGDPTGLPQPLGLAEKLSVLRGSEASNVSF